MMSILDGIHNYSYLHQIYKKVWITPHSLTFVDIHKSFTQMGIHSSTLVDMDIKIGLRLTVQRTSSGGKWISKYPIKDNSIPTKPGTGEVGR